LGLLPFSSFLLLHTLNDLSSPLAIGTRSDSDSAFCLAIISSHADTVKLSNEVNSNCDKPMIKNRNHSNGVKRLLRKKNTEQFATDSAWTNNPDDAKVFTDILEAAQECARRDLHNVEVTLRVDAHACDFFCTKLD